MTTTAARPEGGKGSVWVWILVALSAPVLASAFWIGFVHGEPTYRFLRDFRHAYSQPEWRLIAICRYVSWAIAASGLAHLALCARLIQRRRYPVERRKCLIAGVILLVGAFGLIAFWSVYMMPAVAMRDAVNPTRQQAPMPPRRATQGDAATRGISALCGSDINSVRRLACGWN